jgi:hypothetical protein
MVGGWTVRVSGQHGSLAARPVPRTVTPRGPLLAGEQATVDLFEKARASVVYISTQARVMDAWTRNVFRVPRGTGSGFIWDADGHRVGARPIAADGRWPQSDRAPDSDRCGDQSRQLGRATARQRRPSDRREHRHLQSLGSIGRRRLRDSCGHRESRRSAADRIGPLRPACTRNRSTKD